MDDIQFYKSQIDPYAGLKNLIIIGIVIIIIVVIIYLKNRKKNKLDNKTSQKKITRILETGDNERGGESFKESLDLKKLTSDDEETIQNERSLNEDQIEETNYNYSSDIEKELIKNALKKNLPQKIDSWSSCIAKGQNEEAIESILFFTKKNNLKKYHKEIITLSSRYKNIINGYNKGILKSEEVFLETNRINDSLINLIYRMEREYI